MMNKRWSVSLLAALMLGAPLVHAQGNNASGGKSKAATCAGCHGEDGNSAMPGFPKLAGQHQAYLSKQLLAFKKGERIAPMMAPLALGLDEKSIEEIAAYYASNKISGNPAPALPNSDDDDDAPAKTPEQKQAELANVLAKGKDIYRNGILPKEVSACIACHGPYAEGNKPAAYPALHSQHADYLVKTLIDFKNGNRTHNKENVMAMIAAKMSDDEIKAVSLYISTMK